MRNKDSNKLKTRWCVKQDKIKRGYTVETADRDSMLNKIVWANRIVHFRARLYHCGDPLYKIGG